MERNKYEPKIVAQGSLQFMDEVNLIEGSLEVAGTLILDGDTKISGDVKSVEILCRGNLEVGGNVNTEELHVVGQVIVEKSAEVGFMDAAYIYVGGNLKSTDEIDAWILTVGGDLEAFIVSLGNDEERRLEDVLLVDGEKHIEEAVYVNNEEI